MKKDSARFRIRRIERRWRVVWEYRLLPPLFNSWGAAAAFMDGLFKGRKPV